MKVYKLKADLDYSLMYPEDKVFQSENFEFNAKPLIDHLPEFQAYFDTSKGRPIPDIAYLGMATFAFRKDVAEKMTEILESAGEMLPFYCGEELWYCLNVLSVYDALDEDESEYEYNDGLIKLNIKKYVFDKQKIKKISLFKIPNDNFSQIYCADRRQTDSQVMNNFFCAVHANEFTGLKFVEVFSDE